MINSALVYLWEQRVGAVAWNDFTQTGSFEYDPDFLKLNLDIAPIMMPIAQSKNKVYNFPENRNTGFHGLPGMLADVLPDKYGHSLISAWLATMGRNSNSLSPIEILCFINNRAMGALEIEPAMRKEKASNHKLELNALIEIAAKLLNQKNEFSTNLKKDEEKAMADLLKIGTSAGGARAKAIIAYNPKTGEVKSGQVNVPQGFEYWIIKFDGVHDAQFDSSNGYGRVEMAYHKMAVDSGIIMSDCQLLEENGRAHFMTKRFDRTETGEKIHMQSLCAMRHFDFNKVGQFAYEQLFETLRYLQFPYPDVEQVFLRMVFNVLSRNCDDHTKNFAFLMNSNGQWSLSPAYDICHAYRPNSPWVSHQSLSVNGKVDDINENDFMLVAENMNIRKAKSLIGRVKSSVKNWKNFAEEQNVNPALRDAIQNTLLV
jgi:serine/threonine-protein kinase HipA